MMSMRRRAVTRQAESGHSSERNPVLEEVAGKTPCLQTGPIAVDVDAIEFLMKGRVLLTAGTDHADVIAGIPQRAGFLPHPPVEGHG